jgi:hypothetical protein
MEMVRYITMIDKDENTSACNNRKYDAHIEELTEG